MHDDLPKARSEREASVAQVNGESRHTTYALITNFRKNVATKAQMAHSNSKTKLSIISQQLKPASVLVHRHWNLEAASKTNQPKKQNVVKLRLFLTYR